MNNTKYWLDSTTIQAALRALVPLIVLVCAAFGVNLGEGELLALIEALIKVGTAIWAVVEIVNVIRGRFKADKPLSGHK